MGNGLLERVVFVKLRNQIGQRDIDETADRKRQHEGGKYAQILADGKSKDSPDDRNCRRQKIQQESSSDRIAGVQENPEVGQLLRNFMDQYGDSGSDSQRD